MKAELFAVSIIGSILLPVVLAIALRRRYRAPWIDFCVGMLTFVGAQVVHIPLNELLASFGIVPDVAAGGSQLVWTAVVLGLTAGLTEELARAVGYRFMPRARSYGDGLMMGLGHGGIEAMLFGGVLVAASVSSLLLIQNGDLLESGVTTAELAMLRQQFDLVVASPTLAFAPLVERTLSLLLQVVLSLIVLQAFRRHNWKYVLVAILYHAAVDFVAVYGAQQIDNPWLIELILAVTVLPGVIWAWRLPSRRDDVASDQLASARQDLSSFVVAVGKEVMYQWRTRRVLIVIAVFLLFGMISPLVAKFTPEIIGSLEGAEQFADLIPEPTVVDAMGQYISNLTQFGFILTILLGMGAIASEKEQGTAAMILSKPLSRWAFVLSKFVAQAGLYFVAFALAAVAAYYYTLYLFSSVNPGSFILLNFLLYLWLLVFAAVTLLGSAIGRTTGAAAGIAGLGSVILLLAGTLPRFGALAPGGLVAWANQLATENVVVANIGAVVTGLVLVSITIIAAVAVFEEQEV